MVQGRLALFLRGGTVESTGWMNVGLMICVGGSRRFINCSEHLSRCLSYFEAFRNVYDFGNRRMIFDEGIKTSEMRCLFSILYLRAEAFILTRLPYQCY